MIIFLLLLGCADEAIVGLLKLLPFLVPDYKTKPDVDKLIQSIPVSVFYFIIMKDT